MRSTAGALVWLLLSAPAVSAASADTAKGPPAAPAGRGGWIGIQMKNAPSGVVVSMVPSGTPASKAGLRTGDVIRRINGQKAASVDQAAALFVARRPGSTVRLRLRRGAKEKRVNVVLGDQGNAPRVLARACATGDPAGCTILGVMHQQGWPGMQRDPTKAAALFRKACDGGSADGCQRLAYAYMSGQGGQRDPKQAARLYRRACDRGSAAGCTGLGATYDRGWGGLPRDEVAAARLYRKGCDGGDYTGCGNLGIKYQHGGGGLQRDLKRAKRLYRMACKGGIKRACERLEALRRR